MEFFEDLITDFGKELNIPLHLDKIGCCLLNVNGTLRVQIEFVESREAVLIASHIADLIPGKVRENVLKDALKANHEYGHKSIFAYSAKNNKISLFTYIPQTIVTPHLLASTFQAFVQKADEWRQAIDTGQTSYLLSRGSSR